jgi:hypothetical protein
MVSNQDKKACVRPTKDGRQEWPLKDACEFHLLRMGMGKMESTVLLVLLNAGSKDVYKGAIGWSAFSGASLSRLQPMP